MPNDTSFDKTIHDASVARRREAVSRGKKNPDREKTDNRSLDVRLKVAEELLGIRP